MYNKNKYKQTSNALFDIFIQYDDPSQYTAEGAVGFGATFDLANGRFKAAWGPGVGIRFGFKRRYSSYGFECETD